MAWSVQRVFVVNAKRDGEAVKLKLRSALMPLACLAIGACHFPGGHHTPAGQVVATVNGREITLLELRAELADADVPNDPKALKAAEQKALQTIIVRDLLAKVARDQHLDKTPYFALEQSRLTDGLLAQTLQRKLANEVPAPTPDEAERFVADHPDIFDQRKIFTVDQIRMDQPSDPNLMLKLKPLNTMADVGALLTQEHVNYQSGTGAIDAAAVDPDLIDAIVKLPPNEVFIFSSGNSVLINQIRDTQIVPFTGDAANKYALRLLTSQRIQQALAKQVSEIVANPANSVRYNPAYQPPKSTPQPAQPVAGAVSSGPSNGG